MSFSLTEQSLAGLFFMHRYRYFSINQFAKIASVGYDASASMLRRMEKIGLLGHFGNVPVAGYGKTPKIYFLTRKGWFFLAEQIDSLAEREGGYRKVKNTVKWSPKMNHQIKLIDVFVQLENEVSQLSGYEIVAVFLEHKMAKVSGGGVRRETTDYIADAETPDNRIIPDGAFIMERKRDAKRFLFFVELDNGTETITSKIPTNFHQSVQHKYVQYTKYLTSKRYSGKYKQWGEFGFFSMLFVTTTNKRAYNVADSLEFIDENLRKFFYISSFEATIDYLLKSYWLYPSAPRTKRVVINY